MAPKTSSIAKLGFFWLGVFFFVSSLPSQTLFIDYSAVVKPHFLLAYDVSILSPYAEVDLNPGHKAGNQFYAYLSVGEIAPDAPYRDQVIGKKIPFFGKNEVWQSDLVDVSSPAWSDFILGLAASALDKHFDGFFLDTVDSVELLTRKYPAKADSYRQGVIQLVKRLKAAYPAKKIIMNRGFSMIKDLRDCVDGLLVESVFQTYDSAKKSYVAVEPGLTKELLGTLERLKDLQIPVYVVDYVDPAKLDLAKQTADKISRLGFIPLITTIELTGQVLAPMRPKPRFLLNLFGNQTKELENLIKWPADSFMARPVQTVLEWLGYEVSYLNVVNSMPAETLDPKYDGIVLDRFLEIPPDKEDALVNWLLLQRSRGLKLIILGDIPFDGDASRARFMRGLGLEGNGQLVEHAKELKWRCFSEETMNFETKTRLLPTNFRELRAPAGSQIYLSLQGQNQNNQKRVCDSVFVSSWGGVALDPFLTFQRPDFFELWVLDPFRFFAAALQVEPSPVPDPTTRDGLRVFYSHIDGDGFGDMSLVEKGKRSAEIVRDRIVKVFPVPITCSIIEAEIRGRVVGQKPEDEQQLTEIARSIFRLPNVQAGSHTYTHPFYWLADDRTALAHEGQTLVLADPYRKELLDVRREIVGSVAYIEEHLLPPGKKMSVFLWSGNCRPAAEALRITQALGIENMNGGETLISEKYPSITAVAPRVIPWDNELQIYAANQNENEFNNNWHGPFYGGYIHVLETFKRTETPRRLKPVNIYFHMYSGDYRDSLKVLEQAFEFALAQKVHAVTAAQYAKIVRDSRITTVFQKSDHDWVLVNEGRLRTFRLPSNGQVPDLFQSRGITGFNFASNFMYVHTDGSPRVELVLSKDPKQHPFLSSSSADINFQKLSPKEVLFTAEDFRPVTVELGGLASNSALNVSVNQESYTLKSDVTGRLTLQLPLKAQVTMTNLGLN